MFVGAFVAEKLDSVHTYWFVQMVVLFRVQVVIEVLELSAGSSMDKTSLLGVPVTNNCRDLCCTPSKIFRIIEKKRESRVRIIALRELHTYTL